MTEVTMSFADRIGRAFAQVAGGIAGRFPAILAAVVVLVIASIVGSLTFAGTRGILARRSTAGHVDVLVARFVRMCVVALGVVVSLALLGVDLMAMAASLGLVGLTLGFALRDVLSNSLSGVMLLVQRPFSIGDTISVAGLEGVVEDVRVRDTVLRTSDGRTAYVPNMTVFNGVVLNSSTSRLRRFEITVPTAVGSDPIAACETVSRAVAGTLGVLADPTPDSAIATIGVQRARIVAHGWVDTRTHGLDATRTAALAAAQSALRQAAIG